MTLTFFVFAFQSIIGLIGTCIVLPRPGVIPPSTRNIDHPSRPWRIFYRAMAICMCNLGACLVIMIPLATLSGNINAGDLSDVTRALLLVALPIPLLIAFYWLLAKAVRKRVSDPQ
ncbi:hypothetical protein C1X64_10850 [Pseudomonas sp. GW456-E7]|nr:hypothetical protein C1X64_10850 [Pseudomonas sp. GW456-E7]